jgi:hypothetical protein
MTAPAATWSDLVHDPLFNLGYGEIWRGHEPAIAASWDAAERQTYDRGRRFGRFVADYEGGRVPLTRSGHIHARCLVLLCLAARLQGWPS